MPEIKSKVRELDHRHYPDWLATERYAEIMRAETLKNAKPGAYTYALAISLSEYIGCEVSAQTVMQLMATGESSIQSMARRLTASAR